MEKLYMILLGCKPQGRHTEQHDIFFGIARSLSQLVEPIVQFWPEAEGKIHLDAWKEVTQVDGHPISIVERSRESEANTPYQLFFLNLGGYKENDFEEYHYKMLVVAKEKGEAIRRAKETAFFKHNASPHIDDKYGVDVDDIYEIEEVLSDEFRIKYRIVIGEKESAQIDDEIHAEYIKLSKLV
ncbi:DUF1543 domain-containing protein [Olivibacter sitiensis]|uniref:DUF1543 domain-containing protein n=1 Tax=Olivibacter sitiensis TaxID=376470 RepID=UPI00041910DC|nr:DUF1543 domain-containing protein [Olivibacter sitiensis]